MRRHLQVVAACLGLIAAGVGVSLSAPPVAQAATAIPYSTSYYVTKNDPTWAYNQGLALGKVANATAGTQRFVVILDFGTMRLSGSTWQVSLFGSSYVSLATAGTIVYQFGIGFYTGAGSDLTSLLYVGFGTSTSGGTVTAAAGAALAAAARSVDQQFRSLVYQQVYAVGANDIEAWSQSSADTAAINWFNGYAGYSGRPIFFNYGSADGCPSTAVPTASSCNPGLTADMIWTVSWSGPAYPLPEIYNTVGTQAKQWKYLSLYSNNTKKAGYFIFQGTMTTYQACQQNGNCSGINNAPSTGWTQLSTQLATAPTAGGSLYSVETDIKWDS